MKRAGVLAIAALAVAPAFAGEADVLDVRYVQASDGTYIFDVTLRHAGDEPGHHIDRWEIVGPDGAVIAVCPVDAPKGGMTFVSILGDVEIGEAVAAVTVRAHDIVHGHGGAELTVDMKGSL